MATTRRRRASAMDDGLIQFLIIGAFVVFSMMQSAAKRRRQAPPGWSEMDEEARAEYLRAHGTTDGDDGEQHSGEFGEVGPGGSANPVPMVSGEIWEELAEPARGGEKEPTPPISYEEAGRAAEADWALGAAPEPLIEEGYEAETMTRYPVVRSSATPVVAPSVSPVASPEQYVLPHDDEPAHEHSVSPDVWGEGGELAADVPGESTAAGGTPGRKTARSWLGTDGRGAAALKRAVILHEIIGPPVSLRDSPDVK